MKKVKKWIWKVWDVIHYYLFEDAIGVIILIPIVLIGFILLLKALGVLKLSPQQAEALRRIRYIPIIHHI